MADPVRLVLWNTEWATPRSRRGPILRSLIESHDPELVCLTEAHTALLADSGHLIASGPDAGYPVKPHRHKVLLWSRAPWRNVERYPDSALPSGRIVRGTTDTGLGPLDVWGVCVPWSRAHVSNGRRDRKPWEDHHTYLRELARLLPTDPRRSIVLGDFNQTVPRRRQPHAMVDRLTGCMSSYRLATGGTFPGVDAQAIDHIYLSPDLHASDLRALPATHQDTRLSDHFGLTATIAT